ncbi:Polysaccharide deacetylase [Labilithrix luteola]|uniref:Polysaccharide deacetylase n=1 Tax=Labilithrix luteola TaxID=1391654 RepID=A0A0K1PQU4_9BACT|nr:polysaccharide deacetylase family protein [Labilithrix luteola]AKU95489.1 Polysaccharide deacetylase [Labilithrix luteola]
MSIDIEDWHQLVARRFSGRLPECSVNVETQTDQILEILDTCAIRATFFVLGLVARAKPELVRRISARGHEIASHGMIHVPLTQLDRARVRAELRDSKALLADVSGTNVVGFRAPEFSIVASNRWALDEIAAAGYRYDSSIYPIAHRRYGIRSFSRRPSRLQLASGPLWELPLGTVPTPFGNLPIAGGGYYRMLPTVVLECAMRLLAGRREHTMLYFHPYEFSTSRLSLEHDALPTSPDGRLMAEVWLALQAIGRHHLRNRAERAFRASRTIRSVDLVDELESTGLNHVSRAA